MRPGFIFCGGVNENGEKSVGLTINGNDCHISGILLEGFDTGIQCNGQGLKLDGVDFRTRAGVGGKKIDSIKMNNIRHDESGYYLRLSPIADVVRRAIYGAN